MVRGIKTKALFFSVLLPLSILPACTKKKADSANVSFEKLGIAKVKYLTGFALNGDPICRGTDENVLRWSNSKKEWSVLGTLPNLPSGYFMEAKCEDAQGNFYSSVSDSGCYVLIGGTGTWKKLDLNYVNATLTSTSEWKADILSNNKGDVAMQTEKRSGGSVKTLRKTAASNTWELILDDSVWVGNLLKITDNGDVFRAGTDIGLHVIKAGTNTSVKVTDCTPSVALNNAYCGYKAAVNQTGGIMFYGGLGEMPMFWLNAGATYPAKPVQVFDRPENTCCFNAGFEYLADGTCLGQANKGGYDDYYLYIRKNGASSWTKAETISDISTKIIYFRANAKGEVYAGPASLGEYPLYKLSY